MSAAERRRSTRSTRVLEATAEAGSWGQVAGVGEVPFRAMLEGMLEGVAFLDREWRFLYLNEAGARNLGGRREELLGKSVFDHYPGLRGSPIHQRFARCLETGEPERFEAPFPGADGLPHWFEFSVQPSAEGVLVLSLDVTERHEAAQEDARLRATFESIDLAAVILDPDGRLTYANTALLQATGWSADEVCGRDWFERFVPDDIRADDRASFDAAIRMGDTPRQHQRELTTRDGRRRTIVWSNSILRDRSGAVTGLAAVGDDVTDRRAREEAFRETSRSVSAALNASEDTIIIYRPVLDPDGEFIDAQVVFANNASQGWLPEVDLVEARGRNLFDLAPDARGGVSELYATVVKTGRPVHVVRESRNLPEPRIMDITVTPYEDGFVHVARDVTELHRTSAELREREEELRRVMGGVEAILAWSRRAGGPLTVSPQVERILGWRPADLTTFDAWNTLVHPDDLDACLAQWASDEDGWRLQYRIRRSDGSYATVDDRGRRFIGSTGERALFSVVVDVSDRVAAAEALRASEEQLRRMVEGVDAMISYQATEDGPVVISPQTERILGYPAERMANFDEWRLAIHADDLPACVETWESGSPSWDMEYRMRRADGVWIWVYDRGRRIARPDGRSGMFAVITDISAQHETAAGLRSSEARFRAMFEENPEAIGVLRPLFAPDGRFLDAEFIAANRTTRERWLGGVPVELVPGTRTSGLWFTGGEEVRAAVAHVAEQGGSWRGEVRTPRDGTEYWSDLSVFPFEAGVAFVGRDITEQKRTELAVRDSEARFRAVTDSAADAIITIDADGTIVSWNPSAERLFGRAAGSLAGQAVTALIPDALVESHLEGSHRFGHGAPISGRLSQLEGRRADGTTFPIELSLADWTVAGRRYATAIIRDVTERRTAEEAVRVASARLRRFLDAGIIGTLVADTSGPVLDANDYWLDLVGHTREGLERGEVDWRAVTAPEDLAADERAIAQVRENGASQAYEKAYVRRDGQRVPVLVTLTTMPGPGEQIGTLVLDMTERHEAAAGLAQLAAFQHSVLDSMAEGMVILDLDGRITSANARASVVLGADLAELARRAEGLCHDAQRADGRPLPADEGPGLRTLRLGESCRDVEMNVGRPDGTRIWLRVNTEPLRDRDGVVTAAVATFADITAEHELSEQLRRSQRLEAVGQLAGGVAHDFNNLLAAIRGYSELAMSMLPSASPARADLEEVLRAADRAAGLTRQLLLFSRRQVLAPKLVDPADVVDGLFPMLRQLVGEHIELLATTDHERALVLADPGQLEQVILNLVVNARDAMPGGGRIEVATRRLDPGSMAAGEARPAWPASRITVADTGSGIDADALPHIFEPFFTTKEAGRGSGMGLATVYGIVGASGGTVSVATSAGRGTTFTIDLPLVEAEGQQEAPPSAAPAASALGDGPDLLRGSALLVEDDAAVRALLARMLGALGWRVTERSSGNAAVASVEAGELREPDLLVTDVRMPGLQGPDLARRLRATWPALPVLFITGLADEVGADADEPGMHVLTKPFDVDELGRSIEATIADGD